MLRWIVMAPKLQSFDAGSYGIAAIVRVFHASLQSGSHVDGKRIIEHSELLLHPNSGLPEFGPL
jgi:hypothetical protein